MTNAGSSVLVSLALGVALLSACSSTISDGQSSPKSPTPHAQAACPLPAPVGRACAAAIDCDLGEVCRIGRCAPR